MTQIEQLEKALEITTRIRDQIRKEQIEDGSFKGMGRLRETAVNLQVEVNRIVWNLNHLQEQYDTRKEVAGNEEINRIAAEEREPANQSNTAKAKMKRREKHT